MNYVLFCFMIHALSNVNLKCYQILKDHSTNVWKTMNTQIQPKSSMSDMSDSKLFSLKISSGAYYCEKIHNISD